MSFKKKVLGHKICTMILPRSIVMTSNKPRGTVGAINNRS